MEEYGSNKHGLPKLTDGNTFCALILFELERVGNCNFPRERTAVWLQSGFSAAGREVRESRKWTLYFSVMLTSAKNPYFCHLKVCQGRPYTGVCFLPAGKSVSVVIGFFTLKPSSPPICSKPSAFEMYLVASLPAAVCICSFLLSPFCQLFAICWNL